jgi:glycerol kinase
MSVAGESSEVILAVDQGTASSKCVCLSRTGEILFTTSTPVSMFCPKDEWMEQLPLEVVESVRQVLLRSVEFCNSVSKHVCGIAISNQRETALAWDRETGEPLGQAISWQCRRSDAICRRLCASAESFRRTTGLPLDPLVTASKWHWMLHESELAEQAQALAREGSLCLGNVDAWLIYWLTGGEVHATDHTNASRTGLLNLESLEWDEEMMQLFGIPSSALPQLRMSADQFGVCHEIDELQGVPIVCVIGDSHAALVAQGPSAAVKATYGTGSSLMAAVSVLPQECLQLARTVAWSTPKGVRYALEGNIAMTGAAVRWVGEFLGFPKPVDDAVALAATVADSAGVIFVPAMVGLGAPYWDAAARGSVHNLGPWHTSAHMVRAAIDSIAFQVADVFEAMEAVSGKRLNEVHADGGATRNRELMQFQADILGRDVFRSRREELSAIGAGWLGGMTLGWWRSIDEPYQTAEPGERFSVQMDAPVREGLRSAWKDAVGRTLTRWGA